MDYHAPLNVSVTPIVIQQSTPGACNLSSLQGGFLSATQFGLAVDVPRKALLADILADGPDQTTVAIVEMSAPGVTWIVQTIPFEMEPSLAVTLDSTASNLNGVPLSGTAFLGFSPALFSLAADASLGVGVPILPPSNGAVPMTVQYTLVIGGVPMEIEQFAATLNVNVITPTLGGINFSYTMGENSITGGGMALPDFSLPVGATQIDGKIQLSGGGFSLDWPVQFTVDPYGTVLGPVVYPGSLQTTTGFGANFNGGVFACQDGSCPAVLSSFFSGAATVFNTGSLLVPNYVPSVKGRVTLTAS